MIRECNRQDRAVRAATQPVTILVNRHDLEPARPVFRVADEYFDIGAACKRVRVVDLNGGQIAPPDLRHGSGDASRARDC